jgi:3-oxoacyl-[acyl-carrier-protein] synthase II
MNAMQHIQRGEADIMLAGASDACVIPTGMGGFSAAKALSKRNDDPQAASRPWDQNRDGFVMGEGAGVLVLEELEHALARGATIHAEVLGGSYTCDAHHMTEPNPTGEGVALCIRRALADAGIQASQVPPPPVHPHAPSRPLATKLRTVCGCIPFRDPLVKAFRPPPPTCCARVVCV